MTEEQQPLSKTKLKQLAKEIEKLGQRLTEMGDNQFAQLEMPDDVREEVVLARETVGRGSHKRQIKHLAGVLRKQDEVVEQIQRQLDALDQVTGGEKRQFHKLEDLRDRLCDAKTFQQAFDEMIELMPQIDRNGIARLSRSVQQHADKRAAREIFRRLRDEMEKE